MQDPRLQFQVTECYDGWGGSQIPDTMQVEVSTPEESCEIYMCLFDVAALYSGINGSREIETIVGTGTKIKVSILGDEDSDQIEFEIPNVLSITVPREEAVRELNNLLSEAVRAHERYDGSEMKEREIEGINARLRRRDMSTVPAKLFYPDREG